MSVTFPISGGNRLETLSRALAVHAHLRHVLRLTRAQRVMVAAAVFTSFIASYRKKGAPEGAPLDAAALCNYLFTAGFTLFVRLWL
jgi:hypothetical protein